MKEKIIEAINEFRTLLSNHMKVHSCDEGHYFADMIKLLDLFQSNLASKNLLSVLLALQNQKEKDVQSDSLYTQTFNLLDKVATKLYSACDVLDYDVTENNDKVLKSFKTLKMGFKKFLDSLEKDFPILLAPAKPFLMGFLIKAESRVQVLTAFRRHNISEKNFITKASRFLEQIEWSKLTPEEKYIEVLALKVPEILQLAQTEFCYFKFISGKDCSVHFIDLSVIRGSLVDLQTKLPSQSLIEKCGLMIESLTNKMAALPTPAEIRKLREQDGVIKERLLKFILYINDTLNKGKGILGWLQTGVKETSKEKMNILKHNCELIISILDQFDQLPLDVGRQCFNDILRHRFFMEELPHLRSLLLSTYKEACDNQDDVVKMLFEQPFAKHVEPERVAEAVERRINERFAEPAAPVAKPAAAEPTAPAAVKPADSAQKSLSNS